MKVISNERVALDTYELVVEGDFDYNVEPGQFLHIKTNRKDLILRRPISIAKYEDRKFYLVYKVVGDGTLAMTTLEKGEDVDILGPLGHGFEDLDYKNVLIVGGGMGVAPLYQLGKELVSKGTKVTFVLGFGTKDMIYYLDKFKELGDVHLTTDDGSAGIKGNVSMIINDMDPYEAIYACGPLPLLKYLQKQFKDHSSLYVSLEERMACGMGACYACDTKDKKHRVCSDGPVFNGNEVEL